MPATCSSEKVVTASNEFIWPIRVYYEDTDSGGVVYYANYLKFMERARTEWLRSLGFEQDILRDQEGALFAVSRVSLDLRRPARFNDALRVSVRVKKRGRASLTLAQEIKGKSDDSLLCFGEVKVVCVDVLRFRPRAIPKSILAVIPDVL